jgi:hypothetical protein
MLVWVLMLVLLSVPACHKFTVFFLCKMVIVLSFILFVNACNYESIC